MTSMIGHRGPRGAAPGEHIPSGYRKATLANFDPQQMALYNRLYDEIGEDSYLSRLARGDEATFQAMEAPAMRQFQGVLANIAGKFGQAGTGGAHGSSFRNAQTSAASNFAQELQATREQLKRQAYQDLMNLSGQLLNQQPYSHQLYEKRQKQGGGAGGLIGAGIGAVGGGLLSGPAGALQGAQAGYGVGNAFSGYGGGGGGGFGNISSVGLPNSWDSLVTDFALQGGM